MIYSVTIPIKVNGVDVEPVEFDIDDGDIYKVIWDGTEYTHRVIEREMLIKICGGRNEILSREPNPVDEIQAYKDQRGDVA